MSQDVKTPWALTYKQLDVRPLDKSSLDHGTMSLLLNFMFFPEVHISLKDE
jgi:hypothetical protein